MVGTKYQTFASWVQKRRRARKQYPPAVKALPSTPTTAGALRLVEALVEPAATNADSVLHVYLPGGASLEVRDARQASLEVQDARQAGLAAEVAQGAGRRTPMLSFTGGLKVFIALEPCDLRKSFNGLHALVSERLGEDPRQGGLFVFTNLRLPRFRRHGGAWLLVG